MPPRIAISLCLDDRGRWRPGRRYSYVDLAYASAVDAAGGLAVQLPIQQDTDALVSRIDGLLIPGGDDFPPPRPDAYPADAAFDPTAPEQLDFDLRILDCARQRGLPVLGVCYGMQLLAIRRGGALHYHLPTDLPDAQPHRLPEESGRHALAIEPDSRLARILGEAAEPVNSLHHQAVSDPGPGARACARAPDGVIEATESCDGSFELGVQWHPEKLSGSAGARLFEALVEACR